MKAIIIHGARGNPDSHWFPWLKEKLEEKGYEVIVPQLPHGEEQTLHGWMNCFERLDEEIDENTILIGHSLGCPFILHLLEKHKAKAAFFAGGFVSLLNNKYKEIVRSFVEHFDFEKIQRNCSSFFAYGADNDHNVPIDKLQELADCLHIKLQMIPNGGHLQMKTFPKLLKDIKELEDEKKELRNEKIISF